MSTWSDVRYNEFPSENSSFTRAFLNYVVAQYQEAEALIDPVTKKTLTFLGLQTAVYKVREQLRNKLKKGTVIASICGNSAALIVFYLAAIDLGAVIVPINPASKKYELVKYLDDCEVNCVFTEGEYAKGVEESLKQTKFESISTILLEETQYDDANPSELSLGPEPDIEDTAFIFFSSGTTGPPKAIRYNHRTLLAHLAQILSIMDAYLNKHAFPLLDKDDRVHGVLPYFHAGGLVTVFCMLVQGATVVVNRKWNEENFLHILQDYEITAINIVPPVLRFLAESPLIDSFHLRGLRYIYVGASKCDEQIMRLITYRFPFLLQLVQLYGLTEAGVLLFVTPVGNPHLTSVGRAMPGVRAKILDQYGDLRGENEEGRLMVQAPTLMESYQGIYPPPPLSWFYTGDYASINKEGFVFITGKEKDMIKVRGFQVNPYEIEEAIKKNVAGVQDCAVVAVEHNKDFEQPKAFVVGQAEASAILDFVKENFTSYKHLCGVEFVEEIPRTASGKIQRHILTGKLPPEGIIGETKVDKRYADWLGKREEVD